MLMHMLTCSCMVVLLLWSAHWWCDGAPAGGAGAHGARCCDGAATESLLRRSCADQLRRAQTRRAEWGASIIPPDATRRMRSQHHFFRVDLNFNVVAHSPRPPLWPRIATKLPAWLSAWLSAQSW